MITFEVKSLISLILEIVTEKNFMCILIFFYFFDFQTFSQKYLKRVCNLINFNKNKTALLNILISGLISPENFKKLLIHA